MAYIGFGLVMAGLLAAGVAVDRGGSLATAIAMTAAGAALMWLFREEDEDSEKEDGGAAPCGGTPVDRPAGEDGRGAGQDG